MGTSGDNKKGVQEIENETKEEVLFLEEIIDCKDWRFYSNKKHKNS